MSETRGVADDNPDAGASVAPAGQFLDPTIVEHRRRGALVLDEHFGEFAAGSHRSGQGAVDELVIEHGASGEERTGIVRLSPSSALLARRAGPLGYALRPCPTPATTPPTTPPPSLVGRDRADGCVLRRVLGDTEPVRLGARRSVRDASFRNAERIIDIEQAMGLYVEEWIHNTFLAWDWFIVFWNVFYGTFHFAVTIGAMVLLFARHPERYTFMRSTLAATTGVALVGLRSSP